MEKKMSNYPCRLSIIILIPFLFASCVSQPNHSFLNTKYPEYHSEVCFRDNSETEINTDLCGISLNSDNIPEGFEEIDLFYVICEDNKSHLILQLDYLSDEWRISDGNVSIVLDDIETYSYFDYPLKYDHGYERIEIELNENNIKSIKSCSNLIINYHQNKSRVSLRALTAIQDLLTVYDGKTFADVKREAGLSDVIDFQYNHIPIYLDLSLQK